MNDVAEIRQSVNVRELLASYGVEFARGANGNAHCWNAGAHARGDRSASVQVFDDGYKCHGCGESGSAFDVVMHFEGVDFAGAAKLLRARLGIESAHGGRIASVRDFDDLTRPVAPPTKETQPDAIQAVRREILGRIWDCLAFATQPVELFEFGAARGVSEHTLRLTVRDWTAVAAAVVGVVRDGYTRADLEAAGVLKSDGTPWHPFAEVREIREGVKRKASGFIVPVFDGEDSAPVALRWRYYRPGKIKALAQPSGAPLLPVGLDSIERAKAAGPYVVILVEGETDWLAAIDAARVAGINAAVLSHCMMSTRWRPEWSEMLSGAERIVIGFDEGKGDKPAGVERAREIVNQLGKPWLDRITMKLTREGMQDFADLHKNGNLAPLLSAWTAKAEQETHTQQQLVAGLM